MNPQVLLELYNTRPGYFTEEEVDELEKLAKANDLDFKRNPLDADFKLGRTISQAVGGVVEGMTTLPVGDDPRNFPERVAKSLGHLVGFVGGPGKLLAGTKALSGVKGFQTWTELGGSVPMAATNLLFRGAGKITEGAKAKEAWKSIEFLKKNLNATDIVHDALHLGTASAISSWTHGVDEAMSSFIHGSVAGGVFAGIGNYMQLNKMVNSSNETVSKYGAQTVRALAGGISNQLMTVLPQEEVPMEDQIYAFLLGTYFGGKSMPAHKKVAYRKFGEMVKSEQSQNPIERPEDLVGWKDFPKRVQKEILTLKAERESQLAIMAQGLVQEGHLDAPVVGYKGDQYVVIGEPTKNNRVRIQDINDPDAKVKFVKPENLDVNLGLERPEVKTEIIEEKPVDTSVKENTESVDVVTDLPSRLNNLSQQISKRGGYEKEQVATELDKQLKKARDIEDPNEFVENIRKKFSKAEIKEDSAEHHDLLAFHKRVTTEERVAEIALDLNKGIFRRKDVSKNNENIIKKRAPSFFDGLFGRTGEKFILEKVDMYYEGEVKIPVKGGGTRTVKRRYVWETDISRYLDYNSIPSKSSSLKNKKAGKTRAKNGKRYYGVHKDLADKGLYIHSGVKEKGRYVVMPFQVEGGSKATTYVRKKMMVINKHFKGSQKQYNKNRDHFAREMKEFQKMSTKEGKELYDRIIGSNIKALEKINNLPYEKMVKAVREDLNKGKKPRFILNAQELTQRMQVLDSGDPGLRAGGYTHIKDMKDGFRMSIISTEGKELGGRLNHLDGIFVVRQDVFDAMIRDIGAPAEAGVLKGTVASNATGEGAIIGKFAYFRAGNERNQVMKHHKQHGHLYETANKQAGFHKKMGLEVDKILSSKFSTEDGKAIGKYNPLMKEKNPELKDLVNYTLPFEDVRLNTTNFENPKRMLKDTFIVRQMFSTQVEEQMPREVIESFIKENLDKSVKGREDINNIMDKIIEGKGKINLSEKALEKLEVDDISLQNVVNILSGGDSPLFRKVMNHIIKVENNTEWFKGDMVTPEALNEIGQIQNFFSVGDRILKLWGHTPATMNYPHVQKQVDMLMRKYVLHRILRPKIEGSFKAIGNPYSEYKQQTLLDGKKLKYGEYMLQEGAGQKLVQIEGINGGKPITLRRLWDVYGKKNPELFEHVIARVPIDSIGGIRVLNFKGFTKDKGSGVILNPKDMEYLGGMDLDIDSVFVYTRTSKEFRDSIKKNKNEHEVNGKTQEAITDKAKKRWTEEVNKEEEVFLGLNPYTRLQQSVSFERSAKNIGAVVHAKSRVHTLFTLANKRKQTLLKTEINPEDVGLDVGDTVYIKLTPKNDNGKQLREDSRALMNIVLDTPKFKNVNVSSSEFQYELMRSAFKDMRLVDSKGRLIPGHENLLLSDSIKLIKQTIYKELMEVNDALRGTRFVDGEKRTLNLWDPGQDNIINIARRLVDRAEAEGLDIPGSTMVQAQRLSELNADFSVTNWISPKKVQKIMEDFVKLSQSGNKKLSRILLREYNMMKGKLEDMPENTTEQINMKRDFVMDRLTTLVSAKRLMEKSKGLSDEQITSILQDANVLRNDYAILMAQAKEQQVEQQRFVSQKTSVDAINKKIIQQGEKYTPEEKAFFHEVLLSNTYRHEFATFKAYKSNLYTQKRKAEKAKDVEEVERLNFALKNASQLYNNTKVLSIGLGSRAIPNATIASWGADFNSMAKKVGEPGSTSTIKEILGLSKPKSKTTENLSKTNESLSDTQRSKIIDKLRLAYFKEIPDTPRVRKALEDWVQVLKEFPELGKLDKLEQHFAGVLAEKFSAMGLPGISKTPEASRLEDLEFLNKSFLSMKQGNWVERMLGLKKTDKKGNLIWNKYYTYVFPDTLAEIHKYRDLHWLKKKSHVIYKDGTVTKSKEMDVMVPISHMGYQTKIQDLLLQRKEWAEKDIDNVYNDNTKWMSKIPERLGIENAIIGLRNYQAFPGLIGGHPWHKQAILWQKHLKSLEGKSFSILEGGKVKYVDINYIQAKMNKSIDKVVDYISKEIYHGTNRKVFEKDFYDATLKYRDKYGWLDVNKYITHEISHKVFNGKAADLVGNNHTVQFMLKLAQHIQVGDYMVRGTKVRHMSPEQRAKMTSKLLKKVPMREIGFVKDNYFPLREHLKAEKEAYLEKMAVDLAAQGMSEKQIAENILRTKNDMAFKASEDGGVARDLADIFTGSTGNVNRISKELQFKRTGQKRRPGSTLGRSRNNPIPGNNNSMDALRNYMIEAVKAKYNLAMALSTWRTIDSFEVNKAMGKQTENWSRFMRLQANAALGYPSVIPEAWVNDPTFNIKKTLWYKFSDYAMKKRLDTISDKYFDGKKWQGSDEELYSKMAHFANLEAKWSMMTLLASTRTMANNMLGGSVHSIINAGARPWLDAGKLNELRTRIPLAKGEKSNIVRDWDYFTNMAESHGATESWLRAELKANPMFRTSQGSRFMRELMDNMKKNKWESDKATVMEIAQRHGYSTKVMEAAGFFMKVTEARLRRRSFFAHYLNAMDVLEVNKVKFDRDDPWLIKYAMEGVKGTQFIYNNANRPLFSTSNFGRIFSRFQIWTWNSMRFRKDIYKQAKAMGMNPMSKEFERFKRLVMADMFMFSLASMFPATIFENNMPAPWSQLQDLSAVMMGSEKERERAFFGTLPPELSWIQAVSPPSARYIMQPIGNMMKGDWSRFASYQVWTWFPFGRLMRSVAGPNNIIENPMGAINTLTGLPQFQLSAIAKDRRKKKKEEEEALAETEGIMTE